LSTPGKRRSRPETRIDHGHCAALLRKLYSGDNGDDNWPEFL